MKRKTQDLRGRLLLAGALLAVAGIAWGAGLRPHTSANPSPVATAAPERNAVTLISTAVTPTPYQQVATEVASASAQNSVTASRVVAAPSTVAGEAGMRIFRDPETGEIGPPTAEALAASAESVPVDVTNLKQVTLPDGSVMIDLQGHFQESMIMQIDASGKRSTKCVTDPKASDLKAPVAPAPASTREEK